MCSILKIKGFRGLLTLALLLAFMAAAPAQGHAAAKKVAVLPWNVRSAANMDFLRDALNDMLTSRLGAEENITIIRGDRLKTALSGVKGKEITAETATEIGKKLDMDYVLFGSLTLIGTAVSLDASLLDVSEGGIKSFSSTGPNQDSIVALVDNLSKEVIHHFNPKTPLSLKPPLRPTVPVAAAAPSTAPAASMIIRPAAKIKKDKKAPSFWKSGLLKGRFISMAAGDLDGNGEKELFLLEKTSLKIALVEDKDLRVINEIKASSGLEFVSVSVIDSDGDGKVEVYVSALRHLRAASFAVEYNGGSYKISEKNIGWLLRAGHTPGGAPVLLGQRFRGSDGFYGGIVSMKKKGTRLVKDETYIKRLPQKVNLYNFTYMRFNSNTPSEENLLAYDSEGRLVVFKTKKKGWSEQWKSKEYYGGTMHRIEFNKDTSGADTYRFIDVERPLLHMDTNGDGLDELIVRQSRAGGLFKRYARVFKSYSGGSILSLTWDGEFLTENWRTREINGYIADFLIDDLKGGGVQKLIMIVQQDKSIISHTPKSYLLIYDINP